MCGKDAAAFFFLEMYIARSQRIMAQAAGTPCACALRASSNEKPKRVVVATSD